VYNVLHSILLPAAQNMHTSDICFGISHDPLIDIRTIAVSVIVVCCQCDHALDNICIEYSKFKYIIRLTNCIALHSNLFA
jgi:hypothetical protein